MKKTGVTASSVSPGILPLLERPGFQFNSTMNDFRLTFATIRMQKHDQMFTKDSLFPPAYISFS